MKLTFVVQTQNVTGKTCFSCEKKKSIVFHVKKKKKPKMSRLLLELSREALNPCVLLMHGAFLTEHITEGSSSH